MDDLINIIEDLADDAYNIAETASPTTDTEFHYTVVVQLPDGNYKKITYVIQTVKTIVHTIVEGSTKEEYIEQLLPKN